MKTLEEVDFDLYEVLDRAHMLNCQFSDAMVDHQAVEEDPKLKELVDKAGAALMDVYQYAGAKWFRQNPELYRKMDLSGTPKTWKPRKVEDESKSKPQGSDRNEAWFKANIERRAPVKGRSYPGHHDHVNNGTITWEEHCQAWKKYSEVFGQSAEQVAERGGFGWDELCEFLDGTPDTWLPL